MHKGTLALIATLLCALPMLANANSENANHQANPAQGDTPTNPPPPAPAAKVGTVADTKAENLQNKADSPPAKENGSLGLNAEWLTVIFTGVLTVSTALLWRETRRLAIGAEKQAADFRNSLTTAQEHAASTQSLVEETERLVRAMTQTAEALQDGVEHLTQNKG